MPSAAKKIYLDYAATTPVDPRVFRAMDPYFSGKFGNPGSFHSFGQEAIAAVDRSRETIARTISAEFREVIFTSSATEANNLALRGIIAGWRKQNPEQHNPRIIVLSIEHESVLEAARELERDGIEVIYLPVDKRGLVDLKKLHAALNERTVLVSVMYANNEVGTVQPIGEIAKIIREFRIRRSALGDSRKAMAYPLLHTDAAQAFQFLDCDVRKLGVDLMTISSHKIYGPKGSAALYVRGFDPRTSALRPSLSGGGQEFGLRSGTENVAAIVGFAKAVELAASMREKESRRIEKLRDDLWRGIKKICPKAEVNGMANSGLLSPSTSFMSFMSLPNILNLYFPGHAAQDLLTRFDLAGLAASSGSACRARALGSSYVIEALGHSKEWAKSSIRFSLGRPTTQAEIKRASGLIRACI